MNLLMKNLINNIKILNKNFIHLCVKNFYPIKFFIISKMNFLRQTNKNFRKTINLREYAKKSVKTEKVVDDLLLCILSYLRPSKSPEIQKTKEIIKKEEELLKLVKTHQNNIQISEDYKIEIQKKYMIAAMEAIPEPLKKEALKVDFTPTPVHIFGIAKETPKIPDFRVRNEDEDDI